MVPAVTAEPAVIAEAKAALRQAAAERRRQAAAALAPDLAGRRVLGHILASIDLPPGAAVSAFWPLDEELDLREVVAHLHGAGHEIGLPVVLGRGRPLLFRRWQPDTVLVQGGFRVMTPPPAAPEVVPSVLLVPLLAFDSAGYRLGYGGGFYDRTLAKLRAAGPVLAIGVAYAAQEVAEVPREATDQKLDWIVTEESARRVGG